MPDFWNVTQTLAWIIWRDPFVVSRYGECADHSYPEKMRTPKGKVVTVSVTPFRPGPSALYVRAAYCDASDSAAVMSVDQAKESLIDALQRAGVVANGRNSNRGRREEIPSILWLDLAFYEKQTYSGDPVYVSDRRQGGILSDVEWVDVMFPAPTIRKEWPAQTAINVVGVEEHTAPRPVGRPGTKDVINAEFARRVEKGEFERDFTKQAEALLEWVKKTHPDRPEPNITTIKNNIRQAHRAAIDLEA